MLCLLAVMPGQCRCGQPVRKGQRNCPECHRAELRRYRAAAKRKMERLLAALKHLTIEHVETKRVYDRKCLDRYVIINPTEDAVPGTVIAFLPDLKLRVLDESGREHVVSIDQIQEDRTMTLCRNH